MQDILETLNKLIRSTKSSRRTEAIALVEEYWDSPLDGSESERPIQDWVHNRLKKYKPSTHFFYDNYDHQDLKWLVRLGKLDSVQCLKLRSAGTILPEVLKLPNLKGLNLSLAYKQNQKIEGSLLTKFAQIDQTILPNLAGQVGQFGRQFRLNKWPTKFAQFCQLAQIDRPS